MSWAQALQEYAKVKGQFHLPKKDSEEYKQVKAIQAKLAETPVKQETSEPVKKERKPRAMHKSLEPVVTEVKPKAKDAVIAEVPPKKKEVVEKPVVMQVEEEKPKRKRRTKAEIEALRSVEKQKTEEKPEKPKKTAIVKEKVILSFE